MRVVLAASLLLVATSGLLGQSELGPQAGQRTPGFRLPDQHGRRQTLTSVAGPRGTMLVFIRSADW